jgi:hypothetical protein
MVRAVFALYLLRGFGIILDRPVAYQILEGRRAHSGEEIPADGRRWGSQSSARLVEVLRLSRNSER